MFPTQLGEPQDGRQRLIQFVHHPRRQLTDRGEPICMPQLLLQADTLLLDHAAFYQRADLTGDRGDERALLPRNGPSSAAPSASTYATSTFPRYTANDDASRL